MRRGLLYRLLQAAEQIESRWRPLRTVVVNDELPTKLSRRTVYIVMEDDEPWQACVKCPLGCGHKLHINLVPGVRPLWTAGVEDGLATIAPSIWRKDECRCHFWLRAGRITWCD